MSMFEYVSVLTSIVVGLGLAHLLQGVARIAQHPGRNPTYWVHSLWVFASFFNAVFWWWWEFRFAQVDVWTFQLYLFVLSYAVLIYLQCALLFPSDLEGYEGFEAYFYSRRAWFFGCFTASLVLDFADTWLKGAEYFASLGPEYVVATAAQIVLGVVAMASTSRQFHGLFAMLAVMYQLSWALRYYGTIA